MDTTARKPVAKRSGSAARKAVAKRPTESAPAAKSKASSAVDAVSQMARSLEGIHLRSLASKLVEGRRQDLEAIILANRKSFKGIQAVVKRQTDLLKAAIGEWRSVVKVMRVAGPKESIARLDELAKQSFLMAIANVRELAELSAKTQAEAFDLVKQRVNQNIDEVSALLESE